MHCHFIILFLVTRYIRLHVVNWYMNKIVHRLAYQLTRTLVNSYVGYTILIPFSVNSYCGQVVL